MSSNDVKTLRCDSSNGSAVRELTDGHTHTDGTDFIPSIADAGGKNPSQDGGGGMISRPDVIPFIPPGNTNF